MRRLTLLFAVLSVGVSACGEDEGKNPDTAGGPAAEATVPGCRRVASPPARPDGTLKAPRARLEARRVYEVTLTTNCGAFSFRLDQEASPRAAASFASLVKQGFFDGTVFHRIVPGFVIQGGDPTAAGSGGPGYTTRDEPPPDAAYTQGVVAMAKSAQDPPGAAGSQFYVVTGADAGLPPEYAILGKVTKGAEVTARIGELGDPASGGAGTPTETVVIEKATLSEG